MSFKQKTKRGLPLPLLLSACLLIFIIAFSLSTRLPSRDPVNSQGITDALTTGRPITFPAISSLPPPESLPEDSEPITYIADSISDSYDSRGVRLAFTAVNCPVFSGGVADATGRINQILREFCDEIGTLSENERLVAEEDYIFSQTIGSRFETHERNADYTVFIKDQTISVLFRLHSKSGGANTMTTFHAFAFDLLSGDTVTFADYIASDNDFAKQYIQSVFFQWIDRAPENFYTDAKDMLTMGDHLQDFYLTESCLVLFLNPDVISPMVLGPQWIEVPYRELGRS